MEYNNDFIKVNAKKLSEMFGVSPDKIRGYDYRGTLDYELKLRGYTLVDTFHEDRFKFYKIQKLEDKPSYITTVLNIPEDDVLNFANLFAEFAEHNVECELENVSYAKAVSRIAKDINVNLLYAEDWIQKLISNSVINKDGYFYMNSDENGRVAISKNEFDKTIHRADISIALKIRYAEDILPEIEYDKDKADAYIESLKKRREEAEEDLKKCKHYISIKKYAVRNEDKYNLLKEECCELLRRNS